MNLSPPQIALIVWAFGAICIGGYGISEFMGVKNSTLIESKTLSETERRQLERGVAVGVAIMAVVTAVLWPIYIGVRLYLIWSQPSPEDPDDDSDKEGE